MILVDTSAWVEYLRATGTAADKRLTSMMGEPFALTDVVLAELNAGLRDDADARRVQRITGSATFYPVRPLFDYETAAEIYRACRRAGATPGNLTDCLVAAVAINNTLELLSVDSDMKNIAAHSELRLVKI